MKKNCFITITSISAIVLSIMTIILFFYKVSENSIVNSETFISACVGIMGLLVTVVIGYQIYNAVDITQRMAKFEKEQTKSTKIIRDLSEKTKLQEKITRNLNDIINASLVRLSDLQNQTTIDRKQIELSAQYLNAALYGANISRNHALALLAQLRAIKLSFEINEAEHQYGMDAAFYIIIEITNDNFNNPTKYNLKIEDFKVDVDEHISDIKSVFKSKNLAIERLCIDKIKEAINIKIESVNKGLKGTRDRDEWELVCSNILNIKKEYDSLFAEIDKT